MKRMTKNLMKELLKDDNYNEGLAFIANRMMKCNDYSSALKKLRYDCYRMNELVDEFDDDENDENDYYNNVARICTGIYAVICKEFNHYSDYYPMWLLGGM